MMWWQCFTSLFLVDIVVNQPLTLSLGILLQWIYKSKWIGHWSPWEAPIQLQCYQDGLSLSCTSNRCSTHWVTINLCLWQAYRKPAKQISELHKDFLQIQMSVKHLKQQNSFCKKNLTGFYRKKKRPSDLLCGKFYRSSLNVCGHWKRR